MNFQSLITSQFTMSEEKDIAITGTMSVSDMTEAVALLSANIDAKLKEEYDELCKEFSALRLRFENLNVERKKARLAPFQVPHLGTGKKGSNPARHNRETKPPKEKKTAPFRKNLHPSKVICIKGPTCSRRGKGCAYLHV